MILPRQQIRQLLTGRKTEARRPSTYAELKVGRAYPVQYDIKLEAVCRVRIVECGLEQLGDITPKGAWNEGFKRRDDFFAWFEARFGSAEREQLVYVPRFALVTEEQLRLLPKTVVRGGSPQYATSPVAALAATPDPGEAVPKSDQDRFCMEAGQAGVAGQSAAAQARRDRWSLSQRLQRLEADQNADHSKHLRVIRKRIEEMERGQAA